MRTLVILFLVSYFTAQSAFATNGTQPSPVVEASGSNDQGGLFIYRSAYVEGADAINAANGALGAFEDVQGEKHLVISTDDPQNPILEDVLPRINKVPNVPKFLFMENGSKPGDGIYNFLQVQTKLIQKRTRQTIHAMRDDPTGIFVLFMMTAMNTTLYIHFVKHPDFISVGVPAIITFLGNAIYMKSSILKPVETPIDHLKEQMEKIKTLAKSGQKKMGEELGFNSETERSDDYLEASIVFGLYAFTTYIFKSLTGHGIAIPTLGSAILWDAMLNGISNAPLISVARRWQRSESPPLTEEGIDWLLRAQRFALAFLLPHFYAAHDLVGYVGVAAAGVSGWLIFFKGEKMISGFKENALIKNAARAFSDLYHSFDEQFLGKSKSSFKDTAIICGDWLKSLKK